MHLALLWLTRMVVATMMRSLAGYRGGIALLLLALLLALASDTAAIGAIRIPH